MGHALSPTTTPPAAPPLKFQSASCPKLHTPISSHTPPPTPGMRGGLLAHKISSFKYAKQSCNLIWNVWEPGSILQHKIILKLPFNWRKRINRKFGTWVDQTLQEAQADSCLLGKVVRTNTIAFECEEKQLDSLRAEWN